jgi:hypothetical protein
MSTCTQCTKTFQSQSSLNRHQRTSKTCGTQRFQCIICNQTFSTESSHESHLETTKHKKAEAKAANESLAVVGTTVPVGSVQLSTPLVDMITQIIEEKMSKPTIVINNNNNYYNSNNVSTKVNGNLNSCSSSTNTMNTTNTINNSVHIGVARVQNMDFLTPQGMGERINQVFNEGHLKRDKVAVATELVSRACLHDPKTNLPNFFTKDFARHTWGMIDTNENEYPIHPDQLVQNYHISMTKGHVPNYLNQVNKVNQNYHAEKEKFFTNVDSHELTEQYVKANQLAQLSPHEQKEVCSNLNKQVLHATTAMLFQQKQSVPTLQM